MHSLLSGMIQATATTHSVSNKNQVISESAIFHRQASTSNTGRNGRPVYSLSLSSPVCAFYCDSSGEGPILNSNESHLVCFHECFWLILVICFEKFLETGVIRRNERVTHMAVSAASLIWPIYGWSCCHCCCVSVNVPNSWHARVVINLTTTGCKSYQSTFFFFLCETLIWFIAGLLSDISVLLTASM